MRGTQYQVDLIALTLSSLTESNLGLPQYLSWYTLSYQLTARSH